MLLRIDINCDMGESFGVFTIGRDEEIIKHITSANIACGWHGGDPGVMRKTVALAIEHNVNVGAHPGYPDLEGFGRRYMELSYAQMRDYMVYQIGALWAFAKALGAQVKHFKPHGVISNVAARDLKIASALADAVHEVDNSMIFVALAGSLLVEAGRKAGLRVASEAYADRAYLPDGNLVPRGTPGAVIKNETLVAARVSRMLSEGRIQAVDGTDLVVRADTICVHGDTPGAAEFARSMRKAFADAGIEVVPLDRIV